ncbi:J domain-containing protein [Anoxynatronum sibiricum]|uniref:DnaJ domain-containing protein n=1 Tax=Anoxynatronum sibiricum TaxID=210623 RepID=A0ABU9VV33_9CLOT
MYFLLIFTAIGCAVLASKKNRNVFAWLVLGGLLHFIALLIILFLPELEKKEYVAQRDYSKESASPGEENNHTKESNELEENEMPLSPYEMLNCKPGDDIYTVKKQYRKQILKYHPDKYAHLEMPEDLVTLLHKRVIEINRAYEMIANGELK